MNILKQIFWLCIQEVDVTRESYFFPFSFPLRSLWLCVRINDFFIFIFSLRPSRLCGESFLF